MHLLSQTTDYLEQLTSYMAMTEACQSTCGHPVLLTSDIWNSCALCGLSASHRSYRVPADQIKIAIDDQLVKRLADRPVAMLSLAEFVDVVKQYSRSLMARRDIDGITPLQKLLEAHGLARYFEDIRAEIRHLTTER